MAELLILAVGAASFVPVLLMGAISLHPHWPKPSIPPAVRWIGVIVAPDSMASSCIVTGRFAAGTRLGLVHVASAVVRHVCAEGKPALAFRGFHAPRHPAGGAAFSLAGSSREESSCRTKRHATYAPEFATTVGKLILMEAYPSRVAERPGSVTPQQPIQPMKR